MIQIFGGRSNEAFLRWPDNCSFNLEHEGIDKQWPADVSTESVHGLSREELKFILVHKERCRVLRTAAIAYDGHYYRDPDENIKRRAWTKLKGTNLTIECAGQVVERHTLIEERYQDVPKDKL